MVWYLKMVWYIWRDNGTLSSSSTMCSIRWKHSRATRSSHPETSLIILHYNHFSRGSGTRSRSPRYLKNPAFFWETEAMETDSRSWECWGNLETQKIESSKSRRVSKEQSTNPSKYPLYSAPRNTRGVISKPLIIPLAIGISGAASGLLFVCLRQEWHIIQVIIASHLMRVHTCSETHVYACARG